MSGSDPQKYYLTPKVGVWMVLYCAHQLWGLKKILHLSLGKAGPLL